MQLTADELAICQATGTTPEAFLAARDQASDTSTLSAGEQAVCNATGVSAEAFLAARNTASAPAHGLSAGELAVCQATGIAPEAFAAARDGMPGAAVAIASCSFLLNGSAPVEVQLTPSGDFKPWDGRELKPGRWRINQAIATQVIERFKARTNARVVDYEHQTLHKETNGQPAPAAGWITGLAWRDGKGLFGTVDLTARAKQAIADGEYKYVSPVFSYDPTTGNVLDIQMAALTNHPAIDGMQPVTV